MTLPEYDRSDPRHTLTVDQLQRSELCGEKRYAAVTPKQLFGNKSNSLLAQEVFRNNPALYYRLRRHYAIALGEVKGELVPATEGRS